VSKEWKLTFLVEKALISGLKQTAVIEGGICRRKKVFESEGNCTDTLKARESGFRWGSSWNAKISKVSESKCFALAITESDGSIG
jgi:hypothetical protein